ncbi:DNA-binding response regulator [Clostridia bacterium]|nr:DNA-binding response regulator [Clostridia bacterium]
MKTLLCVEDELDLLYDNRHFFEKSGYTVLTAETLKEAREHLAAHTPDAIILDIMLPDGLGLDLLRELREAGDHTPVLLLTAWGRPQNIADGLRAGANDYLPKPFDYDVLLARVETMFRNVKHIPDTITLGALKLDVAASEAFVNGKDLQLTPKQFSLLLHFVQHEGQTMTAEYLYKKIWGQPLNNDSNALRNAAYGLRKKLAGSGYTITADYGNGYRFEKWKAPNGELRGEKE